MEFKLMEGRFYRPDVENVKDAAAVVLGTTLDLGLCRKAIKHYKELGNETAVASWRDTEKRIRGTRTKMREWMRKAKTT